MSQNQFEDILPLWRIETRPEVEKWVQEMLVSLGESPSAVVGARLRQEATAWISREMLTRCLVWLTERGLGASPENGRLRLEVNAAIGQRAPEFTPALPESQARIPYLSWIVPAGFGAALGYMAGVGMNWLLSDHSPAMTFLGATAGAAGVVGLIAWLSQHPPIRQSLEVATGVAAAATATTGTVWAFFGRSPRGFIASLPWLVGAWAVLWCARPQLKPPTAQEIRAQLKPQLETYVTGVLDLLLAVVWASPRREEAKQEALEKGARIPESLLQAFGILHLLVHDEQLVPSQLVGPTRTLLARLRSAGYEWQDLPSGARYTETLEDRFECYGLTTEGEPVEMIEPALLHRGAVVLRGKLRAIPS